MLKAEKIMIEWINRYMIYIAVGFTVIAAVTIRAIAKNYVGNDFHYFLYDIPGNCNSLLYRTFAEVLMRQPDSAIVRIKYLSYIGDFAVTFLALILFRRKYNKIGDLPFFFILTACLLSPVPLIYAAGGMRIDSIGMSLLLSGVLLIRKNLALPAVLPLSLAAFLLPACWPIVIIILIYTAVKQKKQNNISPQTVAAVVFTICLLILSIILENHGGGNYYWGKIFIVNPATEVYFADFGEWFFRMCNIYGYYFATGSLLMAFENRKMRIPALILQLLVLMCVGWQFTSFTAI